MPGALDVGDDGTLDGVETRPGGGGITVFRIPVYERQPAVRDSSCYRCRRRCGKG